MNALLMVLAASFLLAFTVPLTKTELRLSAVREQRRTLQTELLRLRAEKDSLQRYLEQLEDPTFMELQVRRMGYARPGERALIMR